MGIFVPFISAANGVTVTVRARRAQLCVRREDAALAERAAMLTDLRVDETEQISDDRAEVIELLEHDLVTL